MSHSKCQCTKCPHCSLREMSIGAEIRQKVSTVLEKLDQVRDSLNLKAILPRPTVLFHDTNCVSLMFHRDDGGTLQAILRPNGIVLMNGDTQPATETVLRQSSSWLGDLLGTVQTWFHTDIVRHAGFLKAQQDVMVEAKRLVALQRSGHQVDWNRALKALGPLTDAYDKAKSDGAKS